jgi:flagellar basal body-associated protein FliL
MTNQADKEFVDQRPKKVMKEEGLSWIIFVIVPVVIMAVSTIYLLATNTN